MLPSKSGSEKGLPQTKDFLPFTIKPLPQEFYDSIDTLGFQEIAYRVADAFFWGRCSRRYIEADCVRYIELRCPFGEVTEKYLFPRIVPWPYTCL